MEVVPLRASELSVDATSALATPSTVGFWFVVVLGVAGVAVVGGVTGDRAAEIPDVGSADPAGPLEPDNGEGLPAEEFEGQGASGAAEMTCTLVVMASLDGCGCVLLADPGTWRETITPTAAAAITDVAAAQGRIRLRRPGAKTREPR